MEYDPHSVPALWAQWLRGAVKHPPTPEQLQADMNRADILAYRVEKLEVGRLGRVFSCIGGGGEREGKDTRDYTRGTLLERGGEETRAKWYQFLPDVLRG